MGVSFICLPDGDLFPSTIMLAAGLLEIVLFFGRQEEDEADALPKKFQFDPEDDFYLAPPTCQLLHYRHAAVFVGLMEIVLLFGALTTFINLYQNGSLTGVWLTIGATLVFIIACCTTAVMIYGIANEKPQFLRPQITFLNVEIVILLLGCVGSIASMSLGIEWTHSIFAPFVSIPQMEKGFGPIWPFNLAIVSFSGAALGIWFHVIVEGAYDYLLDKKYFETLASLPGCTPTHMEMKRGDAVIK